MTMHVFVYGSLKLHCSNHEILKNAKFICASHTAEMYTMLDLGKFPGVVKIDDDSIPKSKINGEVYEIDYDVLKYLDEFEGIWFTREMVSIECGISVWMYFLNAIPDEYEIIESGIWGF
ncbi:MAG: gamma-glutamylcyclotransferase [Methanosarcinaceae archaeon]|nr:gamma-glutamylcyclotransferase [ANME-2 cluster archaeon]MDF1534592.1 gamma-glutamylcyclotransferase [Methanosarcinaceae archaeon]